MGSFDLSGIWRRHQVSVEIGRGAESDVSVTADDSVFWTGYFRAEGHPAVTPPRRMAIYRAAYAIATANAFGAGGVDGHFAWCAAALERDDIVETLLADEMD